MRNFILFTTLSAIMFTSCDNYQQDTYEEQYVVESYLFANAPLPQVRLSKTIPAFEYYSFEDAAVSGAEVEVRLLSVDGNSIENTFAFDQNRPGIYTTNSTHHVLPLRTYELAINIPETMHQITASTVVPDTFAIQSGFQDTVLYQATEQFEFTLSKSTYPGRQSIYIFSTLVEDPKVQNLTPFYADVYEDETDLIQFSNNSSGILNYANFDENPDGTVTLKYPWIGITFYGETKMIASTIDDNLYDYIRTEEVQLGGSTLSPGEIQNVLTHVKGGIGLFASIASDTVETYIRRANIGF
tara:strand:- start:42280 stop:43176 length:897 start_codon:yes stop_codon:yes gene_type:complete